MKVTDGDLVVSSFAKRKHRLGTVWRVTNALCGFRKICHSDPGGCLFSSMKRQVRCCHGYQKSVVVMGSGGGGGVCVGGGGGGIKYFPSLFSSLFVFFSFLFNTLHSMCSTCV